jgi:hypothetical protein
MDQCCCEEADWFILDRVLLEPSYSELEAKDQSKEGFEGFVFDIDFFEGSSGGGDLDAGGIAVFKIVKEGEAKYIHIYNSHNGYYSHGFETEGFKKQLRGDL